MPDALGIVIDDRPLVEPRGNGLLLSAKDRLDAIDTAGGLGPLLKAIGGVEVLNDKLFPFLNTAELCLLSACSRALYTLIVADDGLWRELALNGLGDPDLDVRLRSETTWQRVATGRKYSKRRLGRLFSDAVHRPLQCARTGIDPSWLSTDNVARETSKIDVSTFIERYELPKLPVVLKGFDSCFSAGMKRWQLGLKEGMKTLQASPSGRFRCGGRSIGPEAFAAYSTSPLVASDESPLYIFDPRFAETFPQLGDDYEVPEIFRGAGRDLFEHLGRARRPDFRWIIAGAARSGSKWHVDPNCTHAWNASLLGRKKWVMLPPWGAPPPGVFPSPDGGSVAQPVSLVEWFLEFYRATRRTREKDLVEFIAEPGDLVFVPSGWWHAVLNVDESFAVTQNYLSTSNLLRAVRFFEQKPDQISGLSRQGGCQREEDRRRTFAGEFKQTLPQEFAHLLEEQSKEVKEGSTVAWSALVPVSNQTKKETAVSTPAFAGFSFGFNINAAEGDDVGSS